MHLAAPRRSLGGAGGASIEVTTSNGLPQPRRSTEDWRHRFVEEMSGLTVMQGTPRAVMRVLGWMVVCEPSQQTAPQIQSDLGLSAGSVSTALRGLCDKGVLERVAWPGDRHIYYRLSPQGWEHALEAWFSSLTEMRRVAERAFDAAGGDDDGRLLAMRRTYALMESGVAELIRQSREPKGLRSPELALHR